MNTETRQSLGGALIGAVLLVIGLVAQLSDANAAKTLGGVMLWGGGILLLVLALKAATNLIRA